MKRQNCKERLSFNWISSSCPRPGDTRHKIKISLYAELLGDERVLKITELRAWCSVHLHAVPSSGQPVKTHQHQHEPLVLLRKMR